MVIYAPKDKRQSELGQMADKKNSFSGAMFDDFKKQSEAALRELSTNADKTEHQVVKAAKGMSKSYKKETAAAAQDMKSFFMDVQKSADDANKTMSDTAYKMFGFVSENQDKLAKETINNIDTMTRHITKAHVETSKHIKRENEKLSVGTGEIFTALTVKALGLQGTLNKLRTLSQSTLSGQNQSLTGKALSVHDKSLSNIDKLGNAFNLPQLAMLAGSRGAGSLAQTVAPAMTSIVGALSKMTPHLAAIGSVAGALSSVVQSAVKIDGILADLSNEVGGDRDFAKKFFYRMQDLKAETHLTGDEMLSLGKSFQNAGWHVMEGTGQVDRYMVVASKLVRVIGLTNDQTGSYTKTLEASGKSATEVFDAYDKMYRSMQDMNLTLADFSTSMTEGEGLWREFGYIGSKSLDQLQSDVLKTKGLFKSFNVDIKETSGALGGLFGDEKTQRKQANIIARSTGMSGKAAYNMLVMDPAQGQERLLNAGMKYLMSNKAANFDKSSDQLKTLGTDAVYSSLINQRAMLNNLSKSSGLDKKVLSQVVSDYRGYQQSHSGASIDQWMESRKHEMNHPGRVAGGIDNAATTLNRSLQETTKDMGERLQTGVNRIAESLVDFIPKATEGFANINSFLSSLAPKMGIAWKQASSGGSSQSFSSALKMFRPDVHSSSKLNLGSPARFKNMIVAESAVKQSPHVESALAKYPGSSGWLSSQFEGGVGTVAPAYRVNKNHRVYTLPGQAAYGAWQMDSGMGVPQKFMNFLKDKHPDTYKQFAPTLGSMGDHKGAFAKAWKSVAAADKAGFLAKQKEFIEPRYLDPMLKMFPDLANSKALQEVAFSASVQHGPGGAAGYFRRAGYGTVDNSHFISNLYRIRSNNMKTERYGREEALAQAALRRETNGGGDMAETNKLLSEIKGHIAEGNTDRKKGNQQVSNRARLEGAGSVAGAVRGNVV